MPLLLMVINLHRRTFFPLLADTLHTDDMFTPPQTLELLQRWQTVVHAEATPHSEISQQSFVSAVESLFKKERKKEIYVATHEQLHESLPMPIQMHQCFSVLTGGD